MALILNQPLSAEHGASPGLIKTLKEAGGTLPTIPSYIRIGFVEFPQARHLTVGWNIFPSKQAYLDYVARPTADAKPRLMIWEIKPEPNVLQPERRDPKTQQVVQKALVLPSFDQVMAAEVTDPISTNADLLSVVRKKLYELSADWPDFEGAQADV